MHGILRSKPELLKLVNIGTAAVADTDYLVDHIHRGYVDHTLAALADQVKAVVASRYDTPHKGGCKHRELTGTIRPGSRNVRILSVGNRSFYNCGVS